MQRLTRKRMCSRSSCLSCLCIKVQISFYGDNTNTGSVLYSSKVLVSRLKYYFTYAGRCFWLWRAGASVALANVLLERTFISSFNYVLSGLYHHTSTKCKSPGSALTTINGSLSCPTAMVLLQDGQKKQRVYHLQKWVSNLSPPLLLLTSNVERKVKCDEVKPACERCRKATYKCAGYDQPWLDETPYVLAAQERKRERDELCLARLDPFLTKEAVMSQGFLPAERVAQELNLSAFREDICRSFLFHRLCPGGNFSKAISWWLNPAPRVEVQSRTLVLAGKAMAAAFFGRIHQQPRIINEGTRYYGEALRNLNIDLSHKEKQLAFETLGATMALNMYEVCHCSSYPS